MGLSISKFQQSHSERSFPEIDDALIEVASFNTPADFNAIAELCWNSRITDLDSRLRAGKESIQQAKDAYIKNRCQELQDSLRFRPDLLLSMFITDRSAGKNSKKVLIAYMVIKAPDSGKIGGTPGGSDVSQVDGSGGLEEIIDVQAEQQHANEKLDPGYESLEDETWSVQHSKNGEPSAMTTHPQSSPNLSREPSKLANDKSFKTRYYDATTPTDGEKRSRNSPEIEQQGDNMVLEKDLGDGYSSRYWEITELATESLFSPLSQSHMVMRLVERAYDRASARNDRCNPNGLTMKGLCVAALKRRKMYKMAGFRGRTAGSFYWLSRRNKRLAMVYPFRKGQTKS